MSKRKKTKKHKNIRPVNSSIKKNDYTRMKFNPLINFFAHHIKIITSGVVVSLVVSILLHVGNELIHPSYEIGDIVTFGTYEQDNNVDNGKEKIDWIVIGKENNQYLILSKNILDICTYNDTDKPISWELCSLRKWLNTDFYNSNFSENEKGKIVTVKNVNQDNERYGTEGGNTTSDNVFLLSVSEAKKYLTEETAFGISTAYAVKKVLLPLNLIWVILKIQCIY